MVILRRGFKTEANAIAREVRRELSLGLADPLDPRRLAAYLGIPVVPLSSFKLVAPRAVRHFVSVDRQVFSAVTVFDGSSRLVVYNDSHDPGRQNSDLAHELSHALLLHAPKPAIDHRGCRDWDREMEEEANWLAGALLVSEEAALKLARQGIPVDRAARIYGVTRKMVKFRLNVTGAQVRVRRAVGVGAGSTRAN